MQGFVPSLGVASVEKLKAGKIQTFDELFAQWFLWSAEGNASGTQGRQASGQAADAATAEQAAWREGRREGRGSARIPEARLATAIAIAPRFP